jgi:hypothetical protein
MTRTLLLGLLLALPIPVWAETPQQILDPVASRPAVRPRRHAARSSSAPNPGPDGEAASCTSCHTEDAKARGQHVKTHKEIEPLAPVANKERFTDPAKVEKWFKRNCKEVLGRVCTAQEKADFTAYMLSVK